MNNKTPRTRFRPVEQDIGFDAAGKIRTEYSPADHYFDPLAEEIDFIGGLLKG